MKRFLVITAFISLLQMESKTQSLEISCDRPQMIYNDHVGNEWAYGFQCNEKMYDWDKPFSIPLSMASSLSFILQEQDEYTDQASQLIPIDPAKMEFNKSYTKTLELIIKENRGRYAGNTAKWAVTVHMKKVPART